MSKFILTVFSEGGCGIEVSIGPCLKVSERFSSPWMPTEEAADKPMVGSKESLLFQVRQEAVAQIPCLSSF